MNSFLLEGDMSELMHKEDEPLRGLKIYIHDGKKKNVKPRCELCAFCEVLEDEAFGFLVCSKMNTRVMKYSKCDNFNISRQMLNDIYHGCII